MNEPQFLKSSIDAGGAVSNAWELLKRNYGLYLGMSLLLLLMVGCIPCLNLFIAGPITGGMFYVVLRDMRGEPIEFGMLFKGFEKFVPLMVVGLIQSVPEIIGQVLRFSVDLGRLGLNSGSGADANFYQSSGYGLPVVASGVLGIVLIVALGIGLFAAVWRMALFFAVPLALEYDMPPIDAIKLSLRAAGNNIGGLIILLLFEFLIGMAGVLLCFVGVFFVSIPLMLIANAFVYRQVFPYMGDRTMNLGPPPPDAYGSFGGSI